MKNVTGDGTQAGIYIRRVQGFICSNNDVDNSGTADSISVFFSEDGVLRDNIVDEAIEQSGNTNVTESGTLVIT